MSVEPVSSGEPDLCELSRAMVAELRGGHIDEVERMYLRLCQLQPRARELLVFPVLFAIQRGQALEALHFIDSLPAGRAPGLRPLCLQVLGDPCWHGEASALLESADPSLVRAMRHLLGMSPTA